MQRAAGHRFALRRVPSEHAAASGRGEPRLTAAIKSGQPHPLYAELLKTGDVSWNFTKFLVGKDGKAIQMFDSGVEPDAAELTSAIDKALAAK